MGRIIVASTVICLLGLLAGAAIADERRPGRAVVRDSLGVVRATIEERRDTGRYIIRDQRGVVRGTVETRRPVVRGRQR